MKGLMIQSGLTIHHFGTLGGTQLMLMMCQHCCFNPSISRRSSTVNKAAIWWRAVNAVDRHDVVREYVHQSSSLQMGFHAVHFFPHYFQVEHFHFHFTSRMALTYLAASKW